MSEVLKKFGRYFLLDQIARGGMAEIYRARLTSSEGASRLLVIKRIQAGFGANNEFLQMFKSEIKVTMGFNHPNIVQLYDFGDEQGQPYIAMELVDGKNLRQFQSRFSELKKTFPIELAVTIIEQAASALNYAHGFKDKITGEPLNVVHRDISPQNILISWEGNIKIIDFGIAKATTNSESTRAGVIKGKPSYLAPEQIIGESLDGRSDIFALGIVFWELLAGKKLFAGDNDLAILKLIESCNSHVKAPSTINPRVPKELDYIVLKALTKQREKRYQTAEEFQRALHRFLYSYNPDFNPSDLAYYAKDLFKNEIVEDRKRIQKLNDKAEAILLSGEGNEIIISNSIGENTDTVVDQKETPSKKSRPEIFDATPDSGIKIEFEAHSEKNGSPAGFSSAKTPFSLPTTQAPGPDQVKHGGLSKSSSSHSSARARGQQKTKLKHKKNFAIPLAIAAAAVLAIVVLGPRYTDKSKSPVVSIREPANVPTQAKSQSSQPTAAATQTKTIALRLNFIPTGNVTATLNGQAINIENPVIQAPLDTSLELVAERHGFLAFRREFVLESQQVNGLTEWSMDVQLEPVKFGFLTIHTTPRADATIMLDGQQWLLHTPLDNEKFPVGTYSIKLKNELLGMEKTVNVTIQEGKTIVMDNIKLDINN
jgi:eukaryotic-like serine/threonine-protein kinase